MSGTVNISRNIWNDAAFRDEPFTQREAWMWLIMEASYKPRERRVGSAVVSLRRGQVATSIRFMAKAWQWTKSRVERFIDMLENRDMIETQTETGITVITLCKYDDYQSAIKSTGTPAEENRDSAGTAPGQHRDKPNKELFKDARKEEGIEDTNVSLQVSPANDAAEAVSIYNETAARAGWPQVQKMTPNRSKSLRARLAEVGGIDGWRHAMDRAAHSDFLCGRTPKPWTGCSFDWLIKAQSFTKLMEGNYDNRNREIGRDTQGRANRPDPALEQMARLAGLGAASGNGGG